MGASSLPSIAELRAVTQPDSLLARPGAEHWAGRLYMRRLSPYVTRLFAATPLSADAVTALMIPAGLLAALSLTLSGLPGAAGAVVLAQVWLLLDCCDGELARWRRTVSPVGIYLDGVSHAVVQAALPAALGIRAAGGWHSLDGWTMLGLAVSVLVLFVSVESYLVHFVRAQTGKPVLEAGGEGLSPRPRAVRKLRQAIGFVPFYRAFNPIEATLIAFAAAVADVFRDDLLATHVLLLTLLAAAVLTAVGHLIVIVASDRLR